MSHRGLHLRRSFSLAALSSSAAIQDNDGAEADNKGDQQLGHKESMSFRFVDPRAFRVALSLPLLLASAAAR